MLDSYGLPLMAVAAVVLLTFIRRPEGEPVAVVIDFPQAEHPATIALPDGATLSGRRDMIRQNLAGLGVDVDRLPLDRLEPLELIAVVQRELLGYLDVCREIEGQR